ncbi:MAG: hypothetical protein JWN61_2173, partial [Pseudonocardiales bacterium]|nr:hypothetical protein [Pseudonocardiales bacterium]
WTRSSTDEPLWTEGWNCRWDPLGAGTSSSSLAPMTRRGLEAVSVGAGVHVARFGIIIGGLWPLILIHATADLKTILGRRDIGIDVASSAVFVTFGLWLPLRTR